VADAFDVGLEASGHAFAVRVYPAAEPNGALLVWAHGGGFLGGSLDMPEADEVARRIAESGASVVSVGYSLAPPDPLPGGHDVSRLPPTLIVTAGRDHLRPSAEAFAAELAVAGVDVAIVQERAFEHGFLNEIGNPAALRTIARFAHALAQ
jgi:acetyl esterase